MSPGAWPALRVPGKVFLAGEYGVLVGGPALVMAVRRFARLAGTHARPATDFEAGGLERLRAGGVPLPEGLPAVDATELRDAEGQKLGLGSSAAWSVAVTVSALAADGEAAGDDLPRAWSLAHAVHGGGSGADVAACLHGGVLRFQRPDPGAPPRLEAAVLPEDCLPLVIHGGQAVSTASALSALDGGQSERLLRLAAAAGEALCEALGSGDPAAIRSTTREAAGCLEALGRAAGLGADTGAEVVEATRRALRPFGGEAKPSGASGAELVLAYVPGVERSDRGRVKQALDRAGLQVMDLEVCTEGATLGEAPQRIS